MTFYLFLLGDDLDEEWVQVEGFPDYEVSNTGQVKRSATGRIIKESKTKDGTIKVGLILSGVQYSRSVKVLIADAFVSGRSTVFNTPIHLDGDHKNNRADNLMWRPRWFAWKYSRQFEEHVPGQNRKVKDAETGVVYENMVHAATTHGLLIYDVWRSVVIRKPAFPTWKMFDFH